MYTFKVSGEDDDGTTGTVRVHGDRVRIDMDKRGNDREYILVVDGGTRMLSVHPDKREVDQISSPSFEHIIGTSLSAVSPLVKFKVMNAKISSSRVATGEKMLGYSTEHMRITESYDVKTTAMGFDGGTEHNVVTSDYWVSPGLELGRNPLLALLSNASTATAQTDHAFVQKQEDVRRAALQGTPLKTVVSEVTTGDHGKDNSKTKTTEITSIRKGPQPAALFEIPSGYKLKTGMDIRV